MTRPSSQPSAGLKRVFRPSTFPKRGPDATRRSPKNQGQLHFENFFDPPSPNPDVIH
jgi:hypothetical protein